MTVRAGGIHLTLKKKRKEETRKQVWEERRRGRMGVKEKSLRLTRVAGKPAISETVVKCHLHFRGLAGGGAPTSCDTAQARPAKQEGQERIV
jgi:hypothetical protein